MARVIEPGRGRTLPEPQVAFGLQVFFHDGLTCHTCFGTGTRRTGRWWYDPRRKPTRTGAYARLRRAVIDEHVKEVGLVCPGYGRERHAVAPAELSIDHIVALAADGDPLDRRNLGVLCKACNRRKSKR